MSSIFVGKFSSWCSSVCAALCRRTGWKTAGIAREKRKQTADFRTHDTGRDRDDSATLTKVQTVSVDFYSRAGSTTLRKRGVHKWGMIGDSM